MRKLIILCLLFSMPAMAQKKSREMIYVGPDNKNERVIERYNRCHFRPFLNMNQVHYGYKARDFTAVFGVRSNSLMSNADIELSFVKKRILNPIYNDKEDRVYFVEIKNKTNHTIYVDRSICFRFDSDGTKYCYYDPDNASDSLAIQRIIVIPPHSKRNLTDYRWVKKAGNYVEIVEYPEEFLWNLESAGMYEGFVNYGETKYFTENNSPFYRSFVITYSKQEDFSTYSMLTANFYIREITGYYYPENYEYDIMNTRLAGNDKYSITCWLPLY